MDLPLTNEAFRIEVYGVSKYGPGHKATIYANPDKTTLTGNIRIVIMEVVSDMHFIL